MKRFLFGALLALASAGIVRASGSVFVTMVSQGPAAIQKSGDTTGIAPFAGAVRAIVAHPTDPDIVWIGSVNGGIWKTTNATSSSPQWTAMTDHVRSLSIGAMEMDPTDSSHDVIVAGLGKATAFPTDSSGQKVSGDLFGILRSTNGGTLWLETGSAGLSGQNIDAVAPRGSVILVASKGGSGSDLGGVFRSTDTGLNFKRLSGDATSMLPSGKAYDLVGDPSDTSKLYAAIGGSDADIFFTDTKGSGAWTALALAGGGFGAKLDTASNMKLAVGHDDDTGKSTLYAAIQAQSGEEVRLFRYRSGTWKELDPPGSQECKGFEGIKRNPQIEDLSIAVHPRDVDVVFLGGDGTENEAGPDGDCNTADSPPSGRLVRCNGSDPAGEQCASITGAHTGHFTGPHPDSRTLRFDANRDLLNGDDGGIYRRTSPRSHDGDWASMNGHVSITETHSCALDHVTGRAICGAQDNGTAEQRSGSTVWDNIGCCDGGNVAVAYNSSDSKSVRYFSSQNLGGFARDKCDASSCTTSSPDLKVSGSGGKSLDDTFDPDLPFATPIAANAADWQRLVIASTTVYESLDQGDTLDIVDVSGGAAAFGLATGALAYGGFKDSDDHPNVLYAGSANGLFLRRPSETKLSKTTYPGVPLAVAVDSSDWKSVWAVDTTTVRHSTDAGDTWEDVTGDIADAGAAILRSVAFVPGSTASIVAVGARDGVYVSNSTHPKHWSKVASALPNVVAYQLSYDRGSDRLAVATMGRGLWTMDSARHMNLPPVVKAGPAATVNEGSTFTLEGSYTDPNNGSHDEHYSVLVDFGDGGALGFPVSFSADPDASFTSEHVYVDEGTFTVNVFADDARGGSDRDTTTVTVLNVPPAVGAVTVAPSPVAVGKTVAASATYTDPGIGDDHTATIRWGDASPVTPAVISGSNTSGTASGTHVYAAPGLYQVRVRVEDEDGGVGSATSAFTAVYDPAGGSVTGAGWIEPSASGDRAARGKVHFNLSGQYKSGQATPEGDVRVRLRLQTSDVDFRSTSEDWLVVDGAQAQIGGSGVAGRTTYSYLVTALDGDAKGGGGIDKFRIRIWDPTTSLIVYDTQPGDPDDAPATTALGGGSIVVHP